MATLLQDSFNRANGAVGTADVGGAWTTNGSPVVVSNELELQGGGSDTVRMDVGTNDIDMSFKWRYSWAAACRIKCPDSSVTNGSILVGLSSIRYEEEVGGATRTVKSYTTMADGSVVRAHKQGNRIRVYDDGVEVADVGIYSGPTEYTCVDWRNVSSGTDYIDDILVTDATAYAYDLITPRTAGAFATGTATSLVLAAPSDIAVGDYAVAVVYIGDEAATITFTDWTELGAAEAATVGEVKVYGRFWTGTENLTASLSSGTSGNGGFIMAYAGVDPTTQMDITVATGSAAAATDYTPPSATPVTDGAVVVSVVMTDDDNALQLSASQGFQIRAGGATYDSGAGNQAALGLADKEVLTAASTTLPTWSQMTGGPDDWTYITLVLRPESSTPVTGSSSLDFGATTGSGGSVIPDQSVTGSASLDFGATTGAGGSIIPDQFLTGGASLDFAAAPGAGGSVVNMLQLVTGSTSVDFGMGLNPSGAVEGGIANDSVLYRLVPGNPGPGKISKRPLWRRVDRIATPWSIVITDGVARAVRYPSADLDPDTVYLGGHAYEILDTDEHYPILVAAGFTMEVIG